MASISKDEREHDTSITRSIFDLPAANAEAPLPMLDRRGRLMREVQT